MNFLNTNLTKSAAIRLKKGQRLKITHAKEKERRKRKSEEEERRRREKKTMVALLVVIMATLAVTA